MQNDLAKKWQFYEKRWKIRDFYFHKALKGHITVKYFNREPIMLYYANKWVMSKKKTNDYIYDLIKSDMPFMVSRFGYTELRTIAGYLKTEIIGKSEETNEQLEEWYARLGRDSGFFPVDYKYLKQFVDCMLEAFSMTDVLAMWHLYMEDFVISEYNPNVVLTHLFRLEPWLADSRPWSCALKGKKVLIIHPFENTIISQYSKREKIFPNTDILPEFELKTLKAVQTLCGERDERFNTWFDALDYMYNEAMKIDFDTAIIGCGAYGMPLAAKLKKAGKQAIHLGGATQLLFGIKGRRWEKNYHTKIATLFNDAWVYPDESERPRNSSAVENSCYWK